MIKRARRLDNLTSISSRKCSFYRAGRAIVPLERQVFISRAAEKNQRKGKKKRVWWIPIRWRTSSRRKEEALPFVRGSTFFGTTNDDSRRLIRPDDKRLQLGQLFFPSPLVEKSHLYRAFTWNRFVRLINSIWTTALIARTEWNALARKLMCFVRLAYWSSSAGFIITSTDDAPSDGHF